MSKIERRPAAVGSEGWQWPAGMHRVLRQVLARRPVRSAAELTLELKALTPVGRIHALDAAVELLCRHREHSIVIVGDFDADGATSAALSFLTLHRLGFPAVRYFIPDRFELGYGLTPEVVERTAAFQPALIVTVDNGITSHAGVEAARRRGIDVLITDHHLPSSELPPANAIVNPNAVASNADTSNPVDPNALGDGFDGQHLAGVGVVFYLLAALGKHFGQPSAVLEHIDLVALGTVADLVRLDRSNRILVSQGLKRIRAGRCRPGVAALIAAAGVRLEDVTASTLGFQVGPRLNAAGRLDDMSVGVRCLVTDDPLEADDLAARLDALNRERRELEQRMKGEALELVESVELVQSVERVESIELVQSVERVGSVEVVQSVERVESIELVQSVEGVEAVELGESVESTDALDGERLPHVVCLTHRDWHEGLVGLIASRIKDRYRRPTFAFAPVGGGRLKGSGRSIAGFHLRDALAVVAARNPGMLERFGGHAMAAGLTLAASAFAEFKAAIESVARTQLTAESFAERILSDGELACEDLTVEIAAMLRDAGPWGQGFPEPCFDGRFELLDCKLLKDAHLKMRLRPAEGRAPVDAIAFHRRDAPPLGAELAIAYRLEVNDFHLPPRVQLIVEHMQTI